MPSKPPHMTCLRCGSDSIIPNVRVVDRDANDTRKTQELALARKPDATFFKSEVRVPTTARVCAECGFVETFAVEPGKLWDAYLERLSNGWKE